MNSKTLVLNALIAGIYAALTIALTPISYGPIQVRLSEALTLLAFINPKLVFGLTVGCLLANMASPFGAIDIIVGTLATLIAIYPMKYMPNIYAASLLPVIANGVIIGAELAYLGALPPDTSMVAIMLYIAGGEFLSVSIIGIGLMNLLQRNKTIMSWLNN